jgi:hypothetical protein
VEQLWEIYCCLRAAHPSQTLELLLNAGALEAGMLDIPNMLTPTRCHTRKAEAV